MLTVSATSRDGKRSSFSPTSEAITYPKVSDFFKCKCVLYFVLIYVYNEFNFNLHLNLFCVFHDEIRKQSLFLNTLIKKIYLINNLIYYVKYVYRRVTLCSNTSYIDREVAYCICYILVKIFTFLKRCMKDIYIYIYIYYSFNF